MRHSVHRVSSKTVSPVEPAATLVSVRTDPKKRVTSGHLRKKTGNYFPSADDGYTLDRMNIGLGTDIVCSDVGELADLIYRRANLAIGCDPRDLASLSVGLRPCPARVSAARVDGMRLLYPEAATWTQRGVGILRALAGLHVGHGDIGKLTRELVLSAEAARGARFAELASIQQHAPLSLVQDIFLSHRAKGVRSSGVISF